MSKPLKRRNLEGIQIRRNCLLAYVKVNGRQIARSFPPITDPDKIQEWRLQTRWELRKGRPEKGTLAADIEKFLALPYLSVGKRRRRPLDGRTKQDLQTWLKKWAESALSKLRRDAITQRTIEQALRDWQAQGYGPSSLNHLRQSLITLWRELDGPEHGCPAKQITKFDESGCVRAGFFGAEALSKALAALPPDYRDVVEFAAFSGWRREEIQGLLWTEVDEPGGIIRLSAERSKNRTGRVLPIVGPLVELMQRRADRRTPDLPYVFTYTYGGKRTPARVRRVGDWRKVWAKACKAAGCEGALLHDLRRTVVRNLTRAGVPEKVAMAWTGHKTRSVFDRYNIVNEADLQGAGERLAAHVQAAKKKETDNDAQDK